MANEDPKYLRWVRQQRCVACGAAPPSHPHHDTHQRGMGQRAHDRRAVPLCWRCHRAFHDGTGQFADLTAAERVAAQARWVEATQLFWDDLQDPEVF